MTAVTGDLDRETAQTKATLQDFVRQLDAAISQLRLEIVRARAGGLRPKGEDGSGPDRES